MSIQPDLGPAARVLFRGAALASKEVLGSLSAEALSQINGGHTDVMTCGSVQPDHLGRLLFAARTRDTEGHTFEHHFRASSKETAILYCHSIGWEYGGQVLEIIDAE